MGWFIDRRELVWPVSSASTPTSQRSRCGRRVAYSKSHLPHPLATPCHPLPPNQHATFYATFWQKRSISRENSGSEPSYSGSFLRRVSHGLAWSRTEHRPGRDVTAQEAPERPGSRSCVSHMPGVMMARP